MTDFGDERSCTDSLRTSRFASGPRLVAEACYRRLTTPRGTLRGGDDEQNYGLDLLNLIGTVSSASAAAALPGQIESELLKDERLDSVTATVTSSVVGPSTSWSIVVEGETAEGPFALTLSVDDVTVSLLGITTD